MVADLKFFESIKIRLTNLILKLEIQKHFYSETTLIRLLLMHKRILNWQPFMKRVYTPLALLKPLSLNIIIFY